MSANKTKVLLPFLFVAAACVVRMLIYVYVGIAGIANFAFDNYIGIVVNLIFYFFILSDAYKYFIKGKNITLNSLIFKYGIANLATLIGLRNGNTTIFILTALMLFLVPYVSDNEYVKKKLRAPVAIAVLLCSIAVSVFYIMNPSPNYFAEFGQKIYNLDALNPTVEWIMIVFLLAYKSLNSKKVEQ